MTHIDDKRYVELGVSWFYRTVVKSPPESVESIAAEYLLPVSSVHEAIAEAKRLLDMAADYVKA